MSSGSPFNGNRYRQRGESKDKAEWLTYELGASGIKYCQLILTFGDVCATSDQNQDHTRGDIMYGFKILQGICSSG
jgi:hypothetical protein